MSKWGRVDSLINNERSFALTVLRSMWNLHYLARVTETEVRLSGIVKDAIYLELWNIYLAFSMKTLCIWLMRMCCLILDYLGFFACYLERRYNINRFSAWVPLGNNIYFRLQYFHKILVLIRVRLKLFLTRTDKHTLSFKLTCHELLSSVGVHRLSVNFMKLKLGTKQSGN